MTGIAHGDLVVVIPGILGSTLARDGRQTWGYRQIFRNVHRLGDRLTQDLSLDPGVFGQPGRGWDDGTRVTGVLTTLAMFPGLVAVDGYDNLLRRLRKRFPDDREHIHALPYDWRQSNEYTARRLARFVEPLLEHRRREVPGARVVLVGHSMGGLVARYYAECLDDRGLVRRVVTIGTPYLGSVKALTVLANGFSRLGPVRFGLGDLARSLPSVAELLPVYPCVGTAPDRLTALTAPSVVPELPREALDRSRSFHREIAAGVAARGTERPVYHALLSHWQTTELWALADGGDELRGQPSTGFDDGGDGTVPRCSAVPPEFTDDAGALFVAGRHAALQQQPETLVQLTGILTARPRRPQAAADGISVTAESLVQPGEPWQVAVRSVEHSDTLVLTLSVTDPERAGAEPVAPVALKPRGGGLYTARVLIPEPGLYRWTVRTELTAMTPVEPVTDVLLCTST
ncbi:alpha/beta fold hydrolase [Streptomyces olivaceus]|uniref:alpha/beta fold hydrolase n=1 Tax=Streptomyces TaxID=1883 RepID=UPI0018A835C6|nr:MULTISPECIES: alpha/beta fold hydrolase [Streptomyces]MBF8174889.1 hypothetical protein [Streptomyces olivaceus]MBZ6175208.1 hypothetical protein [Streptomyces olivaceus]MBZ6181650.1 hypothetical protein [Streptomyces olivaceus]UOG82744.1 thioesterase domain-containing protein [Streptomyces sp. CB09030]